MMQVMENRTRTIAMLNDHLRRTGQGGRVIMTRGIAELSEIWRAKVLSAVRDFDDFDDCNDPYGEHDCATFALDGERYMFKIDYYDRNLEHGSEDPADATRTTRVLTIMQAKEY